MPEIKFEIWKTGQYFRGVIRRDKRLQQYYITCEACAGSHLCTEVDTITAKIRSHAVDKIKDFAKRKRFQFRLIKEI